MDLADTDTPQLLKAGGLLERGAGNTVDKLGDLPYFRYWGDAVLMTPIVIAGIGTGVVLFFTVPAVAPVIVPFAKNIAMLPVQIGKGLTQGLGTVGKALADAPSDFKKKKGRGTRKRKKPSLKKQLKESKELNKILLQEERERNKED